MKNQRYQNMTPEQKKVLERDKNKSLYESEYAVIDKSTGEQLYTERMKFMKVSEEPDYIKIYYSTILAFNGISDVPVNFIIAMAQYIPWTNDGSPMIFRSDKLVREGICRACDIKEGMYYKYINRCREYGVLIEKEGYRAIYDVNPFFIARGRWKSIKELRANFDFINGNWERVTVESPDDEEETGKDIA
jgi:hypothetical protein